MLDDLRIFGAGRLQVDSGSNFVLKIPKVLLRVRMLSCQFRQRDCVQMSGRIVRDGSLARVFHSISFRAGFDIRTMTEAAGAGNQAISPGRGGAA